MIVAPLCAAPGEHYCAHMTRRFRALNPHSSENAQCADQLPIIAGNTRLGGAMNVPMPAAAGVEYPALEFHDPRVRTVVVGGVNARHGRHLAVDENNHHMLIDLYIIMCNQVAIGAENFGSGDGTLTGLEPRG